MFSEDSARTTKSTRTRALLRDIALRSFRERGYDATTIRLIAQEAGVSVGTTHYHFAGKSDLVQELYLDVQQRHRDAALPKLDGSDDLIDRLRTVYRTGLDQLEPYHPHSAEFVSAALSPHSEINPLSPASSPARNITEGLFTEAVEGASHALPREIAQRLPGALFLGHLLLALYWAYDGSPGQEKTRRLLDRALALLKTALPLARLPLVRKPVTDLLALIADVRS
ncbi:MAG: TetR/AcrR family transcriptional regulator [Microbacterium sp.]|nr:MAG: TetR/AcrR family transcriptional regulator [Microbacterium sp.]